VRNLGKSGLATLCAACAAAPGALLLLPDPGGALHAPLEVEGAASVLIFTTTDCPIANGYAPEIRSIAAAYAARGVAFWLVHVDPDASAEAARRHAAEYALPGTILLDRRHALVRELGVEVTPEACLLDAKGRVRYQGRIDDRYADFGKQRPEPTVHDLRAALDAVLAGGAVAEPRTRAVGCYVPEVP